MNKTPSGTVPPGPEQGERPLFEETAAPRSLRRWILPASVAFITLGAVMLIASIFWPSGLSVPYAGLVGGPLLMFLGGWWFIMGLRLKNLAVFMKGIQLPETGYQGFDKIDYIVRQEDAVEIVAGADRFRVGRYGLKVNDLDHFYMQTVVGLVEAHRTEPMRFVVRDLRGIEWTDEAKRELASNVIVYNRRWAAYMVGQSVAMQGRKKVEPADVRRFLK